jgi:hypothetical protein
MAVLFVGLFVLALVAESFDTGRIPWESLFPPGAVLAVLVWFAFSRKTVQMDDRALYVSVCRRIVTIPLEEVDTVSETIRSWDRFVTVGFRGETPFGRSIDFSPTFQLTRDPHPIVGEILARADRVRRRACDL